MKTMLLLSESWAVYDPRDLRALVRLARVAEDEGIDGITMSEHIVLGRGAQSVGPKTNSRELDAPGNQDPRTPWPSSLLVMSAIAAATERVLLALGGIIAPLRHPLNVAKDLATLDLLSEGRLVVYPTVSWHADEYAALGVPFHRRGALLDEHLAIWRSVWSASPASHDGAHYPFQDVYVEPKPFRPGGPKLWITGDRLHPAALRRLARYGSGFAPTFPPTREDRDLIEKTVADAGRNGTGLDLQGVVYGRLPNGEGTADLAESLDVLPSLQAAGVTIVVVKPTQFIDDPSQFPTFCRDLVSRFASA